LTKQSLDHGRYVLISPCRNEAEFMRCTLDTVLKQSVLPAKWIIIDDGSTDETPFILAEYAAKNPYIQIITRKDRGYRAVGPGVVDAFYAGYSAIDTSEFEYMCKLDLDLSLPPLYFETLIRRMEANPKIATCSGKSYIEQGGRLVFERHGDDTSLGMTKFYRISCFQAIGGFVREVMWDGIDCHKCRMMGWIACSWDEPELRFIHLRPMGSSQTGIITGRMRHGFGQYYMGTSFWFMLASTISRLTQRPYIVGSLASMLGWIKSALQRKKRYDDPEFRRFVRRYQWKVLLHGKKKALADLGSSA
jgi:poly-beta-1,6-N-acetyl-D-glucosamine synthase